MASWRTKETALVVDPGGTIGWVLADIDPDPGEFTVVGWGEAKGERAQEDWFKMVVDAMQEGQLSDLIIEGYRENARVKSSQVMTIEQIGVLRWLGNWWAVDTHIQFADVKKFATPTKLEPYVSGKTRLTQVGRGGEGHAISALSHLIRWRQATYPHIRHHSKGGTS